MTHRIVVASMTTEPAYSVSLPSWLEHSFAEFAGYIFNCISTICNLSRFSRPNAVRWRVPFVVIDSLKRETFWSLTHVGIKEFKCGPSLADRNTSTTVVNEGWVFGVVATGFHISPSLILATLVSSVLSGRSFKAFFSVTPTRSRPSAVEPRSSRCGVFTAQAFAQPPPVPRCITLGQRNDSEAAKSFTDKVFHMFISPKCIGECSTNTEAEMA